MNVRATNAYLAVPGPIKAEFSHDSVRGAYYGQFERICARKVRDQMSASRACLTPVYSCRVYCWAPEISLIAAALKLKVSFHKMRAAQPINQSCAGRSVSGSVGALPPKSQGRGLELLACRLEFRIRHERKSRWLNHVEPIMQTLRGGPAFMCDISGEIFVSMHSRHPRKVAGCCLDCQWHYAEFYPEQWPAFTEDL